MKYFFMKIFCNEVRALEIFESRKVEFCFLLVSIVTASTAMIVGLSDDEAYYWSWSLRPDLSYFDHPPLLAWILWVSTHIFGKTNFAVRAPAILSFWICALLLIRWGRRFGIVPKQLLSMYVGAPLVFVFSWMALPDVIYIPLALLALDFLWRKNISACGVSLGFSLLAKWHAILLLPGIILAIFYESELFISKIKKVVKVCAIVAALQAPVIVWNLKHGGLSLYYQFVARRGYALTNIFFAPVKGISFFAGFLLISGLPFCYLIFKFCRAQLKNFKFDGEDWILVALFSPFLAVFGIAAVFGDTRIYWTGFAFFPFTIFLLRHMGALISSNLERLAVRSCLSLLMVFCLCLYLPVGSYAKPIITVFRSYDLRMSPVGGFLGWGEWVSKEVPRLHKPPGRTLFLAADFRLAGQLLWNSNLGFDHVSSVILDHQYLIWPSPNRSAYDQIIIFGDNERTIEMRDVRGVCGLSTSPKSQFEVRAHGRTVKMIEYIVCQPAHGA